MDYPFGIANYPDLPVRVRLFLTKEWDNRHQVARPVGRPSKYPWEEWMDGQTHTALAGRDFHVSVHNFRSMLRQKGYQAGMTVWTEPFEVKEMGPTGPVQYWVHFTFVPKGTVRPEAV